MKIVCDCGNEQEFNTIDFDTKKQTDITEGEGQYARIVDFRFWEIHD